MLQYILALISILVFIFLLIKKPKIETYLLFILVGLTFIDTKILPLEYGFVKTFDVVSLIALTVFFKRFMRFARIDTYWGFLVLTLLFWGLALLGNLHSEFGFTNYYLLYQIFTIFIFTRFLIIYCSENWKENRGNMVSALKKGFAISLFFMALQLLIGLEVTYYTNFNPNVVNDSSGLIRYPGIFSESQYNGQFLAMGSLIFLSFQKTQQGYRKYLGYLGFAVGVFFVFMAGSRSAIGGLGIGLMTVLAFANARIKTLAFFGGIALLATYFIAAPDEGVFARAENIGDDLDFRQSIWEETYEIIEEHPVLGIGFGNFEPYLTKYHQDMYLETSDNEILYFQQPENGYLKILVEQGYLSFVIFLSMIIIPLLRGLNGLYKGEIGRNAVYFASAIIAWLVAFNTVYSFLDYRLLTMVGFSLVMLILYRRQAAIAIEGIKAGNLPYNAS